MSTQDNNRKVNPETEELTEENLSEQRRIRREKLKKLQEADRNPFVHETWNVTAHSMDIKENFDAMEDQEVSCAGRIMAFRNMGKASFIDIQDKQGRIEEIRTYTDPQRKIEVRCEIVRYTDYPAVEWTVYVKNNGKANTGIFENLMALDLPFTVGSGETVYLNYNVGGASGISTLTGKAGCRTE